MGYFKCINCGKYGLMPLCELCDDCCKKDIIEKKENNKKVLDEKLDIMIEKLKNQPNKINKIIALLMIINNIDITDEK